MSLKITHLWTCDICGVEQPVTWDSEITMIDGSKHPPIGWVSITLRPYERHLCPEHAILAAHNGDVVTVFKPKEMV